MDRLPTAAAFALPVVAAFSCATLAMALSPHDEVPGMDAESVAKVVTETLLPMGAGGTSLLIFFVAGVAFFAGTSDVVQEALIGGGARKDSTSLDFFHPETTTRPKLKPETQPVDIARAFFKCDAAEVDGRDEKTPDSWVRRNPDLVRLTGRHPFNCEPPLPQLMKAGFITPPALLYVRNHGAVPVKTPTPSDRQKVWDSWSITISGLVDTPLTLTMNDLMALPQRELPVLLVCAGNRRKEQNMVKQTIGFNWGAAGLGTSVWTGVRLRDVLVLAGIKPKSAGAAHVRFAGVAGELPKGSDGSYGTSVPFDKAMDPSQDVLIAFKQNGHFLEPDHGFPVRMIIPGYIGGRMVKWLKTIEVASEESDNEYHFKDNRVLPIGIDAETAEKERWWYKPDYIINELNINSAIGYPEHDEQIDLLSPNKVDISGYAYGGGGRKIIRVEVSLDGGETWLFTELTHPETPTEFGKFWCWCFWKLPVDVSDLASCHDIMCRAWDSSMNTQPKDLTWNVMGMLNNPWFRIRVHKDVPGKLRFEHPTMAGQTPGGWMTHPGDWQISRTGATFYKTGELTDKAFQPTVPVQVGTTATASTDAKPAVGGGLASNGKTFTLEEIAKHEEDDDLWIVVNNRVYDATEYLEEHPGGADSITMNGGGDATEEFAAIHSKNAWKLLEKFYIGDVEGTAPVTIAPTAATTTKEVHEAVALSKKEKRAFKLIEKRELSSDVRLFRFALPTPEHTLGLPTGKHMFLYANVDGETVMRAYTPTSNNNQKGYFDLVIKVYFANVHPRFPDGGKMSQHFESLKVGDTMEAKGPVGHIEYNGRGNFKIGKVEHQVDQVGFICGGTGITPAYQIMQTALRDDDDKTCFHLVLANQTESDILLREEMDGWAKEYPARIKIWYTLDRPPAEGWNYSAGFINDEMLKAHMPAPKNGADKSLVLMCGPPPMIKFACMPNLEKLGFVEDQLHCF